MEKLEAIKVDRMGSAYKILSFVLGLYLLLPTVCKAGEFKVIRVDDGDTIIAEGHDIEIKVRLAGIDAPEIPMWGSYVARSKDYLAEMILNKSVEIKGHGVGPLNRVLGVIYLENKNINLEMVRAGLAVAYRGILLRGSDSTSYIRAEAETRGAKRGMWSLEKEYAPKKWLKIEETNTRER
jgi:micrococcal nuclease